MINALSDKEQVGTYLRRLASSDIKTEAVLKMASDFLFKDEELKKNSGKIITWQSVMEEMMNRRNIKSALAQPLLINLP